MSETPRDDRGPVSWEAFNWMRQEIERLQSENAQLEADAEFWRRQTNHWYMKANYSPEEIAEFQRRMSRELDDDEPDRVRSLVINP